MMTRLVLRIGDMLVCLMRHPPVFIASTFAFLWSGWTLGLHFVPRNFYNNATASWADATIEGLFVALVGTGFVSFLLLRRGR